MMKKKFLITFAIALFVVVLAMVSSALSVDYCNLSFKDSIYIKYAVDADSADVKLLVWTEPQTDYTYGTEDDVLTAKGTENINGTDYYIFDYTKLAARQMTDYVYARAYVESTDSYSDTVKYSVLTYAYNKLGKTSATADNAMKELLENMLSYGASAQSYFNYKAERLANDDFYEVKISGGVLSEDGFNAGLYLAGEQVAIKADAVDGNGVAFSAWKNSTGAVVGTTAEYTVTVGAKNETYTAVYSESPVVDYSEGLEYESNGDGTCVIIGMGTCADADVVIPEISPDGERVIGVEASAFAGEEITSVTFPQSLEYIARRAFNNCASLTDVYYHGTEQDWANVDISTYNTPIENANMHYLVTVEYTVTFVDYDGSVLKTEKVQSGNSATAPTEPIRDGFAFAGWDKTFTNVTADVTVKATYTFNGTEPTIVVNSVNAVAGKENVEVVVELFNNPGIGAMSIMLEYDEDSMSLISAKNGNALVNADGFSFMPPANTNSGMNYSWWNTSATGLPNKELDGILLTLEFNISQEATGELPITFSYLEADVIDFENGTPIELNILDGGIIIS